MDNNTKEVEEANIEFYNNLYKKRNVIIQLIYPFISFDQQSKSKFNYRSIKRVLSEVKDLNNFNFLDYGFGHGSLLLKLPRKVGLYGCDISIEAVGNFPRVAKLLGKKVQTFTPEQLNKNKGLKLNMISLSHVLEHVEDDVLLLKELWLNLKPGGYVLINVPINEVWDDPKHVRKYTADSMKDVLERAGFNVCSVEEKNKLSGYLLINERVKKPGIFKKLFFRSFRLFLALMPLSLIESFDNILGQNYKYQHLIVLAKKNG